MNLSENQGIVDSLKQILEYYDYRETYLESPNWKKKRKRVLDRDNNLCVCGERATYVHHKTYQNLGAELLSDLVALCKNCHDGYHGRLLAKSEFFLAHAGIGGFLD